MEPIPIITSSTSADAAPLPLHVLGIDPGKTGGVVHIGPSGEWLEAWKTPVLGKEYDAIEMNHIISGVSGVTMRSLGMPEAYRIVVAIEAPGAFFARVGVKRAMGAGNALQVGIGWGLWWGLVTAYSLPVEVVRPKQWQKGIPARGAKGPALKKVWRAEAQRRWPDKKVLAYLADAALIADQTRRMLVGQ